MLQLSTQMSKVYFAVKNPFMLFVLELVHNNLIIQCWSYRHELN